MTQRAVLINDATAGAGPHPAGPEFQRRIEAAASAALDSGFKAGPKVVDAEISITLATAGAMQTLNRDFHGVDAPTDVLSFPLDSSGESLLGDLYVCPEVAAESALALGIEVSEEILRLVVHGVLHLLGHDHPDTDARYESEMFRLQERVLQGFGRAAE